MVINTKLKFVFVHIPKAAGTSVMNTLKPLDGDNHRWLAKTKHETLAELHSNIKSRRSVLDKFTGRCPGPSLHLVLYAIRGIEWHHFTGF